VADETYRKLLRSITQCQSHVLLHLLKEKPTAVRSIRAACRLHNFNLTLEREQEFLFRGHYTMLSVSAYHPPPTPTE